MDGSQLPRGPHDDEAVTTMTEAAGLTAPRDPRPTRSRLLIRSMIAVCIAALGLFSAPLAHADPSIPAGCSNVSGGHRFGGIDAYPTYQVEINVRFCWTGGVITTSRISDISGNTFASATTIYQTQNAVGPTNGNRVGINSSARYGNQVTVYSNFQSRNCATGPLEIICSTWTWHQGALTLYANGGSSYTQLS
jgi:hypothetical protein